MKYGAMFAELPNELILIAAGAFLLGWILASISNAISSRYRARKRDPRDDRIRELEAELRIARTDVENSKLNAEKLEDISEQQSKLEKISGDLKDSVLKTRELRSELAERATQNVHAEAKIREVETELSVAQASTDLIATGVLDYSFTPDQSESNDAANNGKPDDAPEEVSKVSS